MNVAGQVPQIQVVGDGPSQNAGVDNSNTRQFYELSASPSAQWRKELDDVWNSNEIENNGDQSVTVRDQEGHAYIIWESSFGLDVSGDPLNTIRQAVGYTNTKINISATLE